MQLNKDFIIVIYFTSHPQLRIYSLQFLLLAIDAARKR